MSLGVFAPMLERIEQPGIHSSQASQVLGVDLVCLALVSVDEPQLPCIGHKDLVAALLQDPACPRGVGSSLDCDAHRRPLGGEASFESLGSCAQSPLLHNLAALLVDEAKVGVFVAYVQSGCHVWMLFATIHVGRSSFLGVRARIECLQTFRVLRIWGVGLLISSSENAVNTEFTFSILHSPGLIQQIVLCIASKIRCSAYIRYLSGPGDGAD